MSGAVASLWLETTLGESFQTVTGNTPPKSRKELYGDAIPLVKPPELTNGDVSSACDGLTEEGSKLARLAPAGSTLVSCIGNLGKIGLTTTEVAFNQQINAIFPNANIALPRFIYFLALSPQFQEQLSALSSGTTVPIVNKSRFNSISLALPPLEEQKRIVAALDQAFVALDRACALAEANLADAKELFVRQRETLISGNKKTWAAMTVADVCERFEYGTSTKSLPEGRVPVLRMGNLQQGELDWSSLVYTDDSGDIKKLALHADDVLFNRTNSAEHVGKTAIFRGEREAIFAGYLIRLHVRKSIINPEYLNIFLNSNAARTYGRTVMGKSVNQANISASKLRTYPLDVPPLAEQEAIVENLLCIREQTDKLTKAFETKLSDLADLRQSLLQQAFSGQLT